MTKWGRLGLRLQTEKNRNKQTDKNKTSKFSKRLIRLLKSYLITFLYRIPPTSSSVLLCMSISIRVSINVSSLWFNLHSVLFVLGYSLICSLTKILKRIAVLVTIPLH